MLRVVNDPGRFSQPAAYIQIGKDIFQTGDGRLIDCSVTVGEGKKQSSCSITISDPKGELAQRYFGGSYIDGGIKLPDQFFETDKSTSEETTISSRFAEQGPPPGGGTNTGAATISNEPAEVKAMLDTIAWAEGANYNTLFGGGTFSNNTDHPNKVINKSGYSSSASGRYQILNTTWFGKNGARGVKSQLGLTDFSPLSQDRAAVQLIKNRGVYEKVKAGDVKGALEGTGGKTGLAYEWASLPPSRYGQPQKSLSSVQAYFKDRLAYWKKQPSTPLPSSPPTLANKASSAQSTATSSTTTTTQTLTRTYEGNYKGVEIKIAFSVDPGTYEIFTFIHSGTEFSGASNCTFKLSGMAIRGVMERRVFKEKKVKTTLKKFAQEIAAKYKLKLDMKFEGPAYEAISQTGQTDLHVLTKLVEEANLYIWEKNKVLYIEKHPAFTDKPIGFILRWGYNLDKITVTENAQTDVKATKTDDAKDKIEAIYPKISILTKPGTAAQSLLENVTGVAKGQKAGTGTNTATLSSYASLVKPSKPDEKKNFKAFILSCEFTTSQAALSSVYPLTPFYIEGFIPFLENRWYVESVTHTANCKFIEYNSSSWQTSCVNAWD